MVQDDDKLERASSSSSAAAVLSQVDNDDDNAGVEASSHPSQSVDDIAAADAGPINSMTVLFNDDNTNDEGDELKASQCDGESPTVTAAVPVTDGSECCSAVDCSSSSTLETTELGNHHRPAEDSVQDAQRSWDNSDDVSHTSTPRPHRSSSADSSSAQSSEVTAVSGRSTAQSDAVRSPTERHQQNVITAELTNHGERETAGARQQTAGGGTTTTTRSAVVFSTVPRHGVDRAQASTVPSAQTTSSSSSSCTIMLTGSTADVRTSPRATQRAVAADDSPDDQRAKSDSAQASRLHKRAGTLL